MSHGSIPAGSIPRQVAVQLCYSLSEMWSDAGDGKKTDGEGGLTPPRGAACAFLGSVPPEAESRRCAHTASDIIIILIMKGQLLQSSSPLRRRECGMQSRRVSLIPSSRGEDTAMPGQSSAGPLTRGDRKRAGFPLGALPAVSLGAGGSLHENRMICDAPSPCHCPAQALLSLSGGKRLFWLLGNACLLQCQSALPIIYQHQLLCQSLFFLPED